MFFLSVLEINVDLCETPFPSLKALDHHIVSDEEIIEHLVIRAGRLYLYSFILVAKV